MTKKPFILVDGSSYLYRAFHAMPSLSNSKGRPTGAVYGVLNMLRKLLADHDPDYIAVVFDAKGKTFRDELYAQYKANRQAMPEELVAQIEPIHTAIKSMGLPIIMIEGVEADDVIGTLAKQAAQQGTDILISTGDKDLAQLVDEKITLVNTMTDTILNPQTVVEKFGVPPELIIDYLTLMGDTSDNIPGVPQVGPKTAVKWLQEYGSLDNIVARADEIKGKVGENLRSALAQIPLSKQLTTIKLDVKLDTKFSDLKRKEADIDALIIQYRDLEFKTWLAQLLEKNTAKSSSKQALNYEIAYTEADLDKWVKILTDAGIFAFDTETTNIDYMHARMVGLSFSAESGKAVYIPFGHDYLGAPPQLSADVVIAKFKPLLENPNLKKIGQNIKYDKEVLANHGISLQGIAYDTMLESYILDSSSNNHNMDALALKYLGVKTISYEDAEGDQKRRGN